MSHPLIRDFEQADAYLGGKTNRPLPGRFTRIIRRRDNEIVIRHYATDIITYFEDGAIRLDTGGWRSFTTKERLNEYTPRDLRIFQRRGVWFWSAGKQLGHFADGIVFSRDGQGWAVYTPASKRPTISRKAVGRYASELAKRWADRSLPCDRAGDCWFCYLRNDAATLGDATGDLSHLVEHVREGYYVPSLLLNAVRENERKFSRIDLYDVQAWIANEPFDFPDIAASITRRRIRSAVVSYFGKRFEFTE